MNRTCRKGLVLTTKKHRLQCGVFLLLQRGKRIGCGGFGLWFYMKSLLYSVAGQLIINALKKRYYLPFLPVAKKGTIKSGRNQDEKTKESGEK